MVLSLRQEQTYEGELFSPGRTQNGGTKDRKLEPRQGSPQSELSNRKTRAQIPAAKVESEGEIYRTTLRIRRPAPGAAAAVESCESGISWGKPARQNRKNGEEAADIQEVKGLTFTLI